MSTTWVELETIVKVDAFEVVDAIIDKGNGWDNQVKIGVSILQNVDEYFGDMDFTIKGFQFFLKETIKMIKEEGKDGEEHINPKYQMLLAMEPLLEEKFWKEEE